MDEPTVAALEAALASATHWHEVGSALRAAIKSGGPAVLASHAAAFDYMLVDRDNEALRDRVGPFGPVYEFAVGTYPMPLAQIPEEALAQWDEAASQIDAPLLGSRYHDLLWCRRRGARPDRHAKAAIDAYARLGADGSDAFLTRTHALLRALELALELGDVPHATRIGVAILERAREAITHEPEHPGIYLTLLEGLVAAPSSVRPTGLLEAALEGEVACADDGYLGDAAADLLVALLPDEASRDAARRRQLARWRDAASRTNGLARMSHMRRGLELATTHGLTDEVNGLRLELQAIRDDDLELKSFATSVEIPRHLLEETIANLVGEDDFISAFRRIGSYGPPSGDPAAAARLAEEIRRDAPLMFLVTHQVLGPENTTVAILETDDDKLRAQISKQQSMQSLFSAAALIDPALVAAVDKYGLPDADVIASALVSPLIDEQVSSVIGAAVRRFLTGDHDGSAHQLTPRLEKVIRRAARQVGVVVTRQPSGGKPGGVRNLGMILADLDGVIPEPWRRYLCNLLTDELGINLRNRIAHGLVESVSREEAVLLVHAAAWLSLLRPMPESVAAS